MPEEPADSLLITWDEPEAAAFDEPTADDEPLVAARPAPVRRGSRRGAPLVISASVAALWAAFLSLAPLAALVAVTGGAPGLGGALRLAARSWLLAHGVPLGVGLDRITLVPLMVTVWVVWRLVRAGVHASRSVGAHRGLGVWPVARAGLAVAVVYALIGMLVAALAGAGSVWRTGGQLGLIAAVCAIAGALRHARAGRRLLSQLPPLLSQAVRAGLCSVAFLLAAGAGVAGLAVARSGGDAARMLGAFHAGFLGQLGITALCLAFLPNIAVWGAAYLVGPGFAAGTGTVVSPTDVLVGPLPALPVFAGLPGAPLSGVAPFLLAVPLVAGLAAGIVLARGNDSWPSLLGSAALAGPVAGIALQLATVASRGGLGSGRLAQLGPYDIRVAMIAAVVISVGTVCGAAARRTLRGRP